MGLKSGEYGGRNSLRIPLSSVERAATRKARRMLLFVYHLCNILGFVNSTVIHNNDRLGTRKRVHLVQEATDELFEALCVVGTFHYVQGNDTIER